MWAKERKYAELIVTAYVIKYYSFWEKISFVEMFLFLFWNTAWVNSSYKGVIKYV